MKLEIERRFLVYPKRLPELKRPKKQIQFYLGENPEIRVRLEENKAILTIKKGESSVREEFEYRIPLQDARRLKDFSNLVIEKTRFHLRLGGLLWEIDVYEGKNKGLFIAEVELPEKDFPIEKPLWIKREITENMRYKNRTLAEKPIKAAELEN